MTADRPTFTNPVWEGYFADPFILASPAGYIAVGTGGGEGGQSLVALLSDDLLTWSPLADALAPDHVPGEVLTPDDVPGEATHLWAPEIARIGGLYVMYYSAGIEDVGHQIRIATSPVPTGRYRDAGVVLTPDEPFAIDAHPFRDDDGQWYLFYAVDRLEEPRVGTAVVVDRLVSPDQLAGDARPVVTASGDWQLFRAGRPMYGGVHDWHTCEGPFVVRRQGRYWCLYSGGNWQESTYGVAAVWAEHPLGPWHEAPGGPGPNVIRSRPGVVHGPGHASVVTDTSGTDWLVYHAWDPDGTARRMCLDRIRWTPDGPVCDGPTTTPQPGPVTRRGS
ncbi:glycoside hydrolase family 43 protein [Georgenia sp. MJ206]|uniref:glycoside hydrolase family 43 protein n=1 Tax=Georgenia wangjunii TaxID=3117730 RepID=UPI002F264FF9